MMIASLRARLIFGTENDIGPKVSAYCLSKDVVECVPGLTSVCVGVSCLRSLDVAQLHIVSF